MSDKKNTSLVPRPAGELARIPPGATEIIDSMVNDATEIIRTDAIRHRIGDYEFRESDYRQILIWAKAVGMTPDELVMEMQSHRLVVSEGAIMEFRWNFEGIGLDLSEVPSLKKVDCRWRKLTGLDLSRVPHLEGLYCWGNPLTDLDLSHVPRLKALDCGLNELTELNLSRIPHLEELYCEGNDLAELDLSRIPHLEALDCGFNELTELNLSRVPHLKELNCYGNQLTELDLSRVPHLEKLCCWGNNLTGLDVSDLKTLIPDVICDPNVLIHKREDQNPKIFVGER